MPRLTLASVLVLVALAGASQSIAGFPQTAPARVGDCIALRDLALARRAGFDFAEVRVVEVAALSDADFDSAASQAKTIGLPTPTAYQFLPDGMRLTGPEPTSPEVETAYVRQAFTRLERLSVHVVGFGSGTARRVPDGYSKDEAFRQLVEFGRLVAAEGRRHGITVAIEPQRPEESNIINSVAEGLRLVNAVNDPNFELLVDFFHLSSVREDSAILLQAGSHVRHLHMANPNGRVFPLRWNEYEYTAFFKNLRAIGYHGLISIEASTPDVVAEAPRAIALLRDALAGLLPPG